MKDYYLNKYVLLTGASSGIGRLIAIALAKCGATVILWGRDREKLQEVVSEIESFDGKAVFYQVDLSDKEAIKTTAREMMSTTGRLNILINCAGIVSGKTLLDLTEEQIEQTFHVNTLALFWLTRAFLPYLEKENDAKIVTVASVAGLVAIPGQTDYSASKFAAVGFMDSLRAELRKQGKSVTTLTVCPYFIDTGMFEGAKTKFPHLLPIMKPEYVARRVVATIPTNKKRLILPRLVSLAPLVRSLPVTVSDALFSFLGLDCSMDTFVGRRDVLKKKDST